ncbi:MAG: hypothetical protein FJZ87_02745 [Chloroflexi bacterium]|nr:hypothetical protein [Chloroflexota bacterium]
MNVKDVLVSQYLASLAMLKQAIVKCPPHVWDDPREKDKFWFAAYHALYYAHVYLKTPGVDFVRWKKPKYENPGAAMSRSQVLEQLASVEREVSVQLPRMNLGGASGHAGLVSNLELQIYNIRHIQQHAGELYQRLSGLDVQLSWASARHAAAPKEKRK